MVEKENKQIGRGSSPEMEVHSVLERYRTGENRKSSNEKVRLKKPKKEVDAKPSKDADFWQPTEEEKSNNQSPFESGKNHTPLEAQGSKSQVEDSKINPGLIPSVEVTDGENASKLEDWANRNRAA